MKAFVTISSVLAIVGPSTCQTTCTADNVLNSLTAVKHYADKMQSVTDGSSGNINPSAVSLNLCVKPHFLREGSGKLTTPLVQPIFKNFEGQTKHLNEDLQCTFDTTPKEQSDICSDYEKFATSQLSYLHVAGGRSFYEKNGHGDNAVKMHGYILQAQDTLENYTSQVKAAAASCADRIDTAYTPLGTQLQKLLEAYPGTA
ncbi:unnamed protein product [Penicillium egyptiacum]|uniref:Uncharacterized protein n=1 Tax=Penicillium egyptiacum TaxID=1303716 RepID=A0A9W4P4P2_9EURO|nr:unnamed protein product [Penicillium egyptiacum]